MSFCKQHCHHKLAELVSCKGARLDEDTLNPKLPDLSQVCLRFTKHNTIHSDKIARGNTEKHLKNRKVFTVGQGCHALVKTWT